MYYGYYYDPMQMLILIISMVITGYASMKVNRAFEKYSRVRSMSGYTGEETARRILMLNNLNAVNIKPIKGSMTDHYNPLTKEVSLSQTVYGADSISAISVAAHEVGHAIQDATGYSFLRFRHKIYPITNIASQLSIPIVILGVIFGIGGLSTLGIGLFALTTLFTLITLPVEFNASSRAIAALSGSGILSPQELDGAKEVLNAAALTYVASAAASILMLLRVIMIFGNRDRD
ncbi:MAG: zinc metallopeptidase [Cellulosilyticaceae bacterium]